MADAPPDDWIKTALNVTGHFEDSADPFAAVSGDFDGMGISLGVLQWNIGSASLQPMVVNLGRAMVVGAMPHYGVDLWMACTSDIAEGLFIVRGWQVGTTLRKPVRQELKAFTRSAPFVDQQVARARRVAKAAYESAAAWVTASGDRPAVDKAAFCWFFDVHTQNGGLKNLAYGDVRAFLMANGSDKADDVICDWLAARTAADAGFKDSIKNAALWRNAVTAATLPLFVLSYLRALKSRTEYRGDVLNRKGAIAVGRGWVHMEQHDLRPVLAA